MILFAADNHYDQHCGRVQCEALKGDYDVEFVEDDWSCFEQDGLADRYELLILNMISGVCDVPMPADACEANVRGYVEAGRPLLLLHGASAAFWQWDWWRPLVGFRWVRGSDPDGFPSSTHPVRPYRLHRAKCRHPLVAKLEEVDFPEDEIYTELEQTCPAVTLMATTTDEGTFVQCYESMADVPGRILGYIPGHRPDVVRHPANVHNLRVLIDDLLASPRRA